MFSVTKTPFASHKASVIAETPVSKTGIAGIVPESPLEETQLYGGDEEEEEDPELKKRLACEPTQAYVAASDNDDDATDDGM
jgi:hypothetical protein